MTNPASSPTPPDAPTPEQLNVLRELVQHESVMRILSLDELDALASLLRAYEGMRADADALAWWASCPWIEITADADPDPDPGREWRVFEIVGPINDREWQTLATGATPIAALHAARAARASAPDSEAENG